MFIGREAFLQELRETLQQDQAVAISGPSGVGKTRVALEFAQRFSAQYQRTIWINAETRETLLADCIELVSSFNLSVQPKPQLAPLLHMLQSWLATHQNYLLVLDNANQPALMKGLFPLPSTQHVLLTTRLQTMESFATNRALDRLSPEDGAQLVLLKGGLISPTAPLEHIDVKQYALALELTHLLNRLPLALEQAGTYIKETSYSLQSYLRLCRERITDLPKSGTDADAYEPGSIATISMLLDYLTRVQPTLIERLRVCAFLAAEDIPEEFFTYDKTTSESQSHKSTRNPQTQEKASEMLLRYSLIKPQIAARSISISPLIQSILRAAIVEKKQQRYIDQALHILHRQILSLAEEDSGQALLLALHIQQLARLSTSQVFAFPEAAAVFAWAGKKFYEQEEYAQAELLMKRALTISEHIYGKEHASVAASYTDLAHLYKARGDYKPAERFFLRAQLIRLRVEGPEHPNTIHALIDLGSIYAIQGKREAAETLYQQALTNCELVLEPEDPIALTALAQMTILYEEWVKSINELSPQAASDEEQEQTQIEAAKILQKLAPLYMAQEKWELAEEAYQQMHAIYERALGSTHPDTVHCLDQQIILATEQGKVDQAESLARQVLQIKEQTLGPRHPDIAVNLNVLATIYIKQGRFEQAEQTLQQALALCTNPLDATDPTVAMNLSSLAVVYVGQGKFKLAASTLERVLLTWEQTLGAEHPQVKIIRAQYQELTALLPQ